MKQTIGRFLLQPDKNFPVDCETLDALQSNIAVVQVLGNIVGDKAILRGCALEQNGTWRAPGHVFLRTADYPGGEVIYWEGGNISGGMYLRQETVAVTAQGYAFPAAYTVRSLAPGIGAENYDWADFHAFKTPAELAARDAEQEAAIALLAPPPLGIVQLWAGASVPAGYALCEGQQLKIEDYPALYAAIGTTFNNAISHAGTAYTTTAGYFRLPDLRGRFVVGYSPVDNEYNAAGKAGGEKKHALTADEMPSHAHQVKDYYYTENLNEAGRDGSDYFAEGGLGSGDHDRDNHYLYYQRHDTATRGGDVPHENRPPYYALAYITRTS
ncbi:MAG: phage tail protein [Odoribacteraceae bacterium]|jgi:microcystin-dependent protein|nr:phage tail protein [Odoribacteraceae bacterium]